MVVSKPRRVERDRNTNTRKEKDKSRETQWYLERLREATRIARDRLTDKGIPTPKRKKTGTET